MLHHLLSGARVNGRREARSASYPNFTQISTRIVVLHLLFLHLYVAREEKKILRRNKISVMNPNSADAVETWPPLLRTLSVRPLQSPH